MFLWVWLEANQMSLVGLSVIVGVFLMLNEVYSYSLKGLIFCQLAVSVAFFFLAKVSFIWMFLLFELSIFPMLFLILGFGSQVEKISATYYILLYTLVCSLPLLIMVCFLGLSDEASVWKMKLGSETKILLLVAFLVKFPVFFLHLWLPKAHVEASTVGSILLASILLKVGSMGYYFLLMGYSWALILVGFVGMSLGSFMTLFQSDTKAMVGYSSVVHMSCILLGLELASIKGAVLLMVSHGFVSGAMFYLVGGLFHFKGSRIVYLLSSLYSSSVFIFILFVISFLGNMGLPPLLSFIAEVSILSSGIIMVGLFMIFIATYLVVSFYYSLFLLVSLVVGNTSLVENQKNQYLSSIVALVLFVVLPVFYLV